MVGFTKMLEIMFKMLKLSLLVMCSIANISADLQIDHKGYILYCPCQGGFGNQADQFLGALSFAHALDRTLVLPPWNEYHPHDRVPRQVPFNTYFSVEAVNEFHKAITMENFMEELAPKLWPVGKRISYCYMPRLSNVDSNERSCNAKLGNPFWAFWDSFNIDFDSSETYEPLDHNTEAEEIVSEWKSKFPPEFHPVLAFTGAPGEYPVRKVNLPLQKYVRWSPEYEDRASEYITENLERPFIGIHLMNSIEFEKVCGYMRPDRNLLSSAQCLGYGNENGPVTKQLCMPSEKSMISQLKKAVEKYKAKSVFIAIDHDPMISQFLKAMPKVKFVTEIIEDKFAKPDLHFDLAILGQADHYIGHCVSSLSAFITRERRFNNKTVEFWNFTPKDYEIMWKL